MPTPYKKAVDNLRVLNGERPNKPHTDVEGIVDRIDDAINKWEMNYVTSPCREELVVIITEALQSQAEEYEREKGERDNIIWGWRECDWPENFDRRTAQLIADNYEKRVTQKYGVDLSE